MNRREWLNTVGPLALCGGIIGTGVALKPRDEYRPAGYLVAGTGEANNVDYVTLDGVRVDHVIEGDDVRGWLRHYEGDGNGMPKVYGNGHESHLRPVYRTGEVRFVWRKESS